MLLKQWIQQLKTNLSFSSALEFFVTKEEKPIAYFEYQASEDVLSLKHSKGLPVKAPIFLRLSESNPLFDPTWLYDPKQISELHSLTEKWFGEGKGRGQYFPLVFNNKVKGIFVSADKDIKDRFFIFTSYAREFLWKTQWEKESPVEELTGCLNAKHFIKRLFVEFSRARRIKMPVSLLLIQLDQFPILSAHYGYKARVFISSLAHNLIKDSRAYDTFGAWPEEGRLGIILPHTSERSASMKAEKIRWSVKSADFSKVFSAHGRLTLSLGLAEYPKVNRSADALYKSALKALVFAHKDYKGNMTALAVPPAGFKPDFSVKNDIGSLRNLT